MTKNYEFNKIEERILALQEERRLTVQQFRLSGNPLTDLDHEEFFDSLVSEPFYENTFLGIQPGGAGDTHGPFIAHELEPDQFKPISFIALTGELNRILNDPDLPPLAGELLEDVEALLGTFPAEKGRYYQLDIPFPDSGYHHPNSWLYMAFHEFVAIDPVENLMYLIVISGV